MQNSIEKQNQNVGFALQANKSKESTTFDELQVLVTKWLAVNPSKRSIAELSRQSGISDSILRRLMNGKNISNDSIKKILCFVFGSNDDYLKITENLMSYPSLLNHFTKNFFYLSQNIEVQNYTSLKRVATSLNNDIFKLALYSIVTANQVTHRDYLVGQLGNKVNDEIEKLIDDEIIVCTEDGRILPTDKNIKMDKEDAIRVLPGLLKYFLKPDGKYNAGSFAGERVSILGYSEIMDLHDSFFKSLLEIIKKHPGEVPVFAGAFVDTLTTDSYFKNKGEIK